MMSLRVAKWMMNLSMLVLVLACSQENRSDPDNVTPWDSLVAARRNRQSGVQGRIDSARPVAMPIQTGDADHDFLRAMSNHHKNVIVLADAALEANTRPDMDSVIRQLEDRHARELDAMTSILRNTYKDGFISSPSAQTKLTASALRQSGSDFRGLFLDAALKAEHEGSLLADFYLLRTKRADVNRIAGEIKKNEAQSLVAIRQQMGGHSADTLRRF